MSQDYKPRGYNSVSPYLVVSDARAVVVFLEKVLDAKPLRMVEGPGGRYMHAEVRIDDSVVMLADAVPGQYEAQPSHLHVYVPDVDATYHRALAAGGESVQEPVVKGDEDKRGGVKDPCGNSWWFGTQQRS